MNADRSSPLLYQLGMYLSILGLAIEGLGVGNWSLIIALFAMLAEAMFKGDGFRRTSSLL